MIISAQMGFTPRIYAEGPLSKIIADQACLLKNYSLPNSQKWNCVRMRYKRSPRTQDISYPQSCWPFRRNRSFSTAIGVITHWP